MPEIDWKPCCWGCIPSLVVPHCLMHGSDTCPGVL